MKAADFPLIINFTPTGMVPTKQMPPYVPISPNEIIEQTHQVFELGITIVHLHARNLDETPSTDPVIYEAILSGIKKFCPGLITCVSLSGRAVSDWRRRAAPLELRPDMGSLTLSSLNFSNQASCNSPQIIMSLLQEMEKYGVTPELEVFDTGMINYANYLLKKKLLRSPMYFNIILGGVATAQFHKALLVYMKSQLPEKSFVSLGGFGDYQYMVHQYAVQEGLGVRVGLEDNIYLDSTHKQKATNYELVKRIHCLASEYNRAVMTPLEFKKLGIVSKKL